MGRRDKTPVVVAKEKPVEEEEVEEEAEEVSSAHESAEDSESEPADSAPPKKKAKKAKASKELESGDEGAAGKKRRKKQRRPSEANHPPTTDMVLEALMALDEKKGTTIKAIKDYIMAENTVRPEHLSHLMRKALPKLLAKEAIIRPKGEENKSVMVGRYKVVKKIEKNSVRERPASLRRLADPNASKKKKKKKRKGSY